MTDTENGSALTMLCADLKGMRGQTHQLCIHIANLLSRCYQDKANTLRVGFLESARQIQEFITHMAVIEDELMAARLEAEKLADAVDEFAKTEGIPLGDIARLSLSHTAQTAMSSAQWSR